MTKIEFQEIKHRKIVQKICSKYFPNRILELEYD